MLCLFKKKGVCVDEGGETEEEQMHDYVEIATAGFVFEKVALFSLEKEDTFKISFIRPNLLNNKRTV